MPFNTLTVGSAVTPTVIETYFSHYLNRKPLQYKPTAHISYHEGLRLIRQFLNYASHHTVEEIQAFTSQWVPCPSWVKVDNVKIEQKFLAEAAAALQQQLGHRGVQQVGGKEWWQWRRDNADFKAEWIEMRADFNQRKKNGDPGRRVMLYVHGGAYFFGSVDEHRYQMQRHARKLKARVFARCIARYRLAPQFPFPCGLHDCLAAYLYLLTVQDPSTIILAGDSAGGGMVVSLLVALRDQGIPLPAGAVLISPWVDLTHSFPSVAGYSSMDYIPAHGFLQRPSAAWPPPNSDDIMEIADEAVGNITKSNRLSTSRKSNETEAAQGVSIIPGAEARKSTSDNPTLQESPVPEPGHNLSIMLDGNLVEIKDQIQMYATNQLISHPLVSPVLQASLGGLPPLLILTGGGEMLRDEQIYLAHKAANPAKYPPGDIHLNADPKAREDLHRWKGTDVQLQVWDDCCHVTPTLSFTRPAKYMYRSIAQFGAWALAHAQKTDIEIMDDDDVSVISSDSEDESSSDDSTIKKAKGGTDSGTSLPDQVGKAGDPLPPFRNHMIRERIDRHGSVFPLAPASSLPALQMAASEIGVIKQGPVRKWVNAKKEWDTKYARQKRAVQKQRASEMAKGYQSFTGDDAPPPSALAGRRRADMPKEEKKSRSTGMSLWSLWGSSHDEKTIEREEKADRNPETKTATASGTTDPRSPQRKAKTFGTAASRSRSRRRTVTDAGQVSADDIDENTSATALLVRKQASNGDTNYLSPTSAAAAGRPRNHQQNASVTSMDSMGNGVAAAAPAPLAPTSSSGRPHNGTVAYPFKLAHEGDKNASTMTLTSVAGVVRPESVGGGGVSGSISGAAGADGRPLTREEEVATPATGLETEPGAAVGAGETSFTNGNEVKRPGPERFVTAAEPDEVLQG